MQSMSDYYSAIQLRSDRWSALREAMAALARDPAGAQSGKLIDKINKLFESLALIEAYWAFPGMQAFDHIRRQFEHRNHEDAAFAVQRITRALTTGAYRRRHIPLERDSADAEEHEDEAIQSLEARALAKPYFEVMIVDDVNEHQERWLKSNFSQNAPARRPVPLRSGGCAQPAGRPDRGAVQPQYSGHRGPARPDHGIQGRAVDPDPISGPGGRH